MNIVILGVSGSGKTTVGDALADRLHWRFTDGDDLHSVANKAKMASGTPLSDADRRGWLEAVGAAMVRATAEHRDQVVACSALKCRYRDLLRCHDPDAVFVYLKVHRDALETRLTARKGHFFPPSLLQDQLDTLEEPAPSEAIVVDGARGVEAVVDAIARRLEI
jgi:gluconokinase